jgi:hypothetical protein
MEDKMEKDFNDEGDFYQDFGGVPIENKASEQEEEELDSSISQEEPGEEIVEEEELEAAELDSEEASEEEEAPREDKKSKSKHSAKGIISSLQREKFQALDALSKREEALFNLQQENERLRQEYLNSSQTAAYHYELRAKEKLDRASNEFRQALEENDYDGQVTAIKKVGEATAEIDRLNMAKAQEAYQQQYYQPQQQVNQQEAYEVHKRDSLQRWGSENTWIVKKSKDYDPVLSESVENFCNQYDAELYRNGYGQYIYSPEYLRDVDNFVSNFRAERKRVNGDLGMKKSRSPVSPVRSGQPSGGKEQIVLSAFEKSMIRDLNVTPEVYLKQRALDRREMAKNSEGRTR